MTGRPSATAASGRWAETHWSSLTDEVLDMVEWLAPDLAEGRKLQVRGPLGDPITSMLPLNWRAPGSDRLIV